MSGADIISSNLPRAMTAAGVAICFEAPAANGDGDGDLPKSKKQKTSMSTSTTSKKSTSAFSTVNITSDLQRKNPDPLQKNCKCHACLNHSRAYIFHLFKAKELLGEILLYTHNQWQFLELFRIIRQKIASKELESWSKELLV